jgi:hypothetical protein
MGDSWLAAATRVYEAAQGVCSTTIRLARASDRALATER